MIRNRLKLQWIAPQELPAREPLPLNKILAISMVVLFAGSLAAQLAKPLISLQELEQWLRTPEAERPSPSITGEVRQRLVDFELTPTVEKQLRAAAAHSRRPLDLVQDLVTATGESWAFDRVLLWSSKGNHKDIAQLVRERRAQFPFEPELVKKLRGAGAKEPAFTLLWPPDPPPKPRPTMQEWRVPTENTVEGPLDYNSDTLAGTVDLDIVVDGTVLVVLKHTSVFYNVACGRNLELRRAVFSSPLPRLPSDMWDYVLDTTKKPGRGAVYTCPHDKRCMEGELDQQRRNPTCVYQDLTDQSDARGYSNPRFVVEDSKGGTAPYQIRIKWALRPYALSGIYRDLELYGADALREKIYARGASFRVTAEMEQDLLKRGANQRIVDEIKRNFRASNWSR